VLDALAALPILLLLLFLVGVALYWFGALLYATFAALTGRAIGRTGAVPKQDSGGG
jgi:uncharacterized iron-regulated membrane protein